MKEPLARALVLGTLLLAPAATRGQALADGWIGLNERGAATGPRLLTHLEAGPDGTHRLTLGVEGAAGIREVRYDLASAGEPAARREIRSRRDEGPGEDPAFLEQVPLAWPPAKVAATLVHADGSTREVGTSLPGLADPSLRVRVLPVYREASIPIPAGLRRGPLLTSVKIALARHPDRPGRVDQVAEVLVAIGHDDPRTSRRPTVERWTLQDVRDLGGRLSIGGLASRAGVSAFAPGDRRYMVWVMARTGAGRVEGYGVWLPAAPAAASGHPVDAAPLTLAVQEVQ